MVELCRASPSDVRSASPRVKHLPPPNMSGLENASEQGGAAPSDGTSLLLMTAQFPGVGTQAERVAMESADRICLSRAAHMKYKYLLGNGARATSEALGYF